MTQIDAPFLTDPSLRRILSALGDGGYQALIVGGAVRNTLLGAPVTDIDIATSAPPSETVRLSEAAGLRAVPTGIDHGTITVVCDGKGYEVTTFRRDVQTDGRHAIVAFSDNLLDDAKRRDFTMNALYADASGRVLDPLAGLPDLAARHLRFVGNPRTRITEDYLRILRFFRFHAWYGTPGAVDRAALEACRDLAPGLDGISRERIGAEMRKLLAANEPAEAVALMDQAGILSRILPGADASQLPALIEQEHAFGTGALPAWPRRLALLAPDDAASDLRLSRDEIRQQHELAQAVAMPTAEAAYRLGRATAAQSVLIRAARGKSPEFGWCHAVARAAEARLPISAQDLMPALTGPALGEALRRAETAFIASDFNLTYDALRDIALDAPAKTQGQSFDA